MSEDVAGYLNLPSPNLGFRASLKNHIAAEPPSRGCCSPAWRYREEESRIFIKRKKSFEYTFKFAICPCSTFRQPFRERRSSRIVPHCIALECHISYCVLSISSRSPFDIHSLMKNSFPFKYFLLAILVCNQEDPK
jgi:hypothetical protein